MFYISQIPALHNTQHMLFKRVTSPVKDICIKWSLCVVLKNFFLILLKISMFQQILSVSNSKMLFKVICALVMLYNPSPQYPVIWSELPRHWKFILLCAGTLLSCAWEAFMEASHAQANISSTQRLVCKTFYVGDLMQQWVHDIDIPVRYGSKSCLWKRVWRLISEPPQRFAHIAYLHSSSNEYLPLTGSHWHWVLLASVA